MKKPVPEDRMFEDASALALSFFFFFPGGGGGASKVMLSQPGYYDLQDLPPDGTADPPCDVRCTLPAALLNFQARNRKAQSKL